MSKHPTFTVLGQPFLSLGGQAFNSNSYQIGTLDDAWRATHAIGGNTVAVPLPWDAFEPEEGVYRADLVTGIIDRARQEDLHIIFLWFATWKNGTMEYCPTYIKQDAARFPRVRCRDGSVLPDLSPHAASNLEADARAFCELMRVLKTYDSGTQTVIGVQVENEPGYYGGTRRDFGEDGEAAWCAPIPQEVLDYAAAHPASRLYQAWQRAGGRTSGTWAEVLGHYGAEGFTAWAIARYIDTVAARGKAVYDLFCYVNVALDGGVRDTGFGVCSLDNFGGGAISKNLDVWYAACSALDAICPDNYHGDEHRHTEAMETYAQPEAGWPLHVPESYQPDFCAPDYSGNSINNAQMFYALGELGAIGYHIFGVEACLNEDGSLEEGAKQVARSFQMLRAVSHLIQSYRGTGRVHAIKQNVGEAGFLLELDGWKAHVSFAGLGTGWHVMDYHHRKSSRAEGAGLLDFGAERARGLVIQVSDHEFYLVGHQCRVMFNRYEPLDGSLPVSLLNTRYQVHNTCFLTLTEGHFEDGAYVTDRVRSGDEARAGIWLMADCGVVHCVLADY